MPKFRSLVSGDIAYIFVLTHSYSTVSVLIHHCTSLSQKKSSDTSLLFFEIIIDLLLEGVIIWSFNDLTKIQ